MKDLAFGVLISANICTLWYTFVSLEDLIITFGYRAFVFLDCLPFIL